ncbi:MAG TPA: L-threonylcarbamoyladenylate synthase [Candidatus Thermoplasmatota archaeon]|nr:L-threonylcarbamoyladenylate synthase [Candidatus Thermoplasmatota archaeon]
MTTLLADDPEALAAAARAMDDRALVVLPTDTLYALAADALDEDAVLEVFRVKGRAADQALPVCVGGFPEVGHVATASPLARRLAERWWPGPLTLVMRAKPWLPNAVTAGGDTVAVRAPGHPFARALATHFGPFTVTSANRSGQPPAADVRAAREQLGGAVRLYVDGGTLLGVPSTIVDCTGDTPRVLREGAVPAAEVAALGP